MKVKVTRIFTLNDAQIKKFMEDKGYDKYSEDDVDGELYYLEASELEEYSDCDLFWGQDIDFLEDEV